MTRAAVRLRAYLDECLDRASRGGRHWLRLPLAPFMKTTRYAERTARAAWAQIRDHFESRLVRIGRSSVSMIALPGTLSPCIRPQGQGKPSALKKNISEHAPQPARSMENLPVSIPAAGKANPDGSTSRRRVRTLAPLLRSPLVAMAAGVSTYALREAAFGIERTDQTWEEVFNALSEDEQRGLELALGRMTNDLVMGGTFGALSSFADTMRWAVKRGEVRSPVEPPSISLALEVAALGRKAHAQGGDLSAQDLREFAGRMLTAYKYDTALAHSIADKVGAEWEAARRHRAEQDRRLARAAGRRFAEARGYPPPDGPPDALRGSRRAVLYDTLEDALHGGDAEAARDVVDEALDGIRTPKLRAKIRQQIRSAALARMPMRPGGRMGRADLEDFRDWMGRNLPDSDREQIERAQRRFITTAVRAGLLAESALDTYAEGEEEDQ